MQKLARDYLNELNKRHKKNRRALVAWILMAVLVVGGVMGTLAQYGFATDETLEATELTTPAAPENSDGTPAPETTTAAPAETTTAAPAETTTAAPAETTTADPDALETTTTAPEGTTAAPEEEPEGTTAAPEESSAEETTVSEGTSEEVSTEETATEPEEMSFPLFDETYTDKERGMEIHIFAEEGVIPEGAQLSVKPVVRKDSEELDQLAEEEKKEAEDTNAKFDEVRKELEATVAKEDKKEILHFVAYDISFLMEDKYGELTEIEPNGEVKVTMNFVKAYLPEEATADKTAQINGVDIVHMKETNGSLKAEVVKDAEVKATEKVEVEKVEFTADSFSTYALTWIGEVEALTYENDDMTITVSEEVKGAIPKYTSLNVVPIVAEEDTAEQYEDVAGKLLEKAEEEPYQVAGFLAYDISFIDQDGNEAKPSGEVKVDIDYKKAALPAEIDEAAYTLAGDEAGITEGALLTGMLEPKVSVAVMLLDEEAPEESGRLADAAEADQARTIIETTEEQKVEKTEFVTDSLPVFATTWSVSYTAELAAVETNSSVDQSILRTNPELQEALEKNHWKNEWQVVEKKYEGNGSSHKTDYSADGNIRVQKNVIPTDVENEFLVYLSVDMKEIFEDYLQIAKYQATTSNSSHNKEPGTIIGDPGGNKMVEVSTTPKTGYNSAKFTILDSNEEIVEDSLTLYWSQAENVTFYLKISETQYLLLGKRINTGDNNTVTLSSAAEEAIRQEVLKAMSLTKVTDQMGSDIEFIDVISGDYESKPLCDESGCLTWIPKIKQNPETEETTTPIDGGTKTTTWNLNVAELVYKVRLKVEDQGFYSCADSLPGDSSIPENERYKVNENAVLHYKNEKNEEKKVNFPEPIVRGLLYDIILEKRDLDSDKPLKPVTQEGETEQQLPTVKFQLLKEETDETGTTVLKPISEKGIDEQGKIRFDRLPWGTYFLVETETLNEYEMLNKFVEGEKIYYPLSENKIGPITLCYTEFIHETDSKRKEELKIKPESETNEEPLIYGNMLYTGNAADFSHVITVVKDGVETETETEIIKQLKDENGAAKGIIAVYNRKKPTQMIVEKKWVGGSETDRPKSIKIQLEYREKGSEDNVKWNLYPDKENSTKAAEYELKPDPAQNGAWKITIQDLPSKYEYRIKEQTVTGYVMSGQVIDVKPIQKEDSSLTVEATITNTKELQLIKRSSSDQSNLLGGAEFQLTASDGNKVCNATSGRTGKIAFNIPEGTELDGTYTMSETKAPEGYALGEAVWNVKFVHNTLVQISDENGNVLTPEDKDGTPTVYIENALAYELPSTGGIGIYWYTIGGVLLMMAGMLILYNNKRSRRCAGV